MGRPLSKPHRRGTLPKQLANGFETHSLEARRRIPGLGPLRSERRVNTRAKLKELLNVWGRWIERHQAPLVFTLLLDFRRF